MPRFFILLEIIPRRSSRGERGVTAWSNSRGNLNTLREFLTGFITLTIFFVVPFFARANIVINEIAWMGSPSSNGETLSKAANNEWIELYNNGSEAVSLDGWMIETQDGGMHITLVGSLAGGGYYLIERTDDDTVPGVSADFISPFGSGLSNAGEVLILKTSSGSEVDKVDASSGWPAGDNDTKQTMQRSSNGWVSASPTPRAANKIVSTNSPPVMPPVSPTSNTSTQTGGPISSSSAVPSIGAYSPISIKVYAGEDKIAFVGSWVEFHGEAFGLKNEPLDHARYWWNFGDGETAEGRVAAHIFQEPGIYTVGLHVSSAEYAASDYLRVEVRHNIIAIASVVEGENGFIKFANDAAQDVAIGGWILVDAVGRKFIIPPKTTIAARAEVAFANRVTGFFGERNLFPLKLLYPNSLLAISYTPVRELYSATSSGMSASSSSLRPQQTVMPSSSVVVDVRDSKSSKEELPLPEKKSAEYAGSGVDKEIQTNFPTVLFFSVALAISILGAAAFLIVKNFII